MYTILHFTTLHSVTLKYPTLIAYITLMNHDITARYVALHYTRPSYTTLHYTNYNYSCKYDYSYN